MPNYYEEWQAHQEMKNRYFTQMFECEFDYTPTEWQLELYIEKKGEDHWDNFLDVQLNAGDVE